MSGYLQPDLLRRAVTSIEFSSNYDDDDPMVQLHIRTFAIWTCLSGIICCIAAFNLQSKPMVWTALASFHVVVVYFGMELGVYGTITLDKLPSMIIVAGVSLVWLHVHLARMSGSSKLD